MTTTSTRCTANTHTHTHTHNYGERDKSVAQQTFEMSSSWLARCARQWTQLYVRWHSDGRYAWNVFTISPTRWRSHVVRSRVPPTRLFNDRLHYLDDSCHAAVPSNSRPEDRSGLLLGLDDVHVKRQRAASGGQLRPRTVLSRRQTHTTTADQQRQHRHNDATCKRRALLACTVDR